MTGPRTLGKVAGRAAAGAAFAGAAALTGGLVARQTAQRRRRPPPSRLGSLRGDPTDVTTDDGLRLYVEVDEPDDPAGEVAPTVVFVHGYALNLDCWHFQRAALRGRYRLVLFDQRSHGRSDRSSLAEATIDRLGDDLRTVVEACVPTGPVVLVGHSMGGMSILAMAARHPELVDKQVAGVALLATSAGELSSVSLGVPGLPGRVTHWMAPAVMAGLSRAPRLVDSGRRVGSGVARSVTRRLAFGGDVPDEYVEFTDEMLSATPFEVIAQFFPGFDTHDKFAALEALSPVPALVLCGTRDQLTPVEHSRRLAERLPRSQLVELPGAGHMVILERHDEVVRRLDGLLRDAAAWSR